MKLSNFFTDLRKRFEKKEEVREISFAGVTSREEIHERLRLGLGRPGYCGSNLDALYDVLTSVSCPIRAVLHIPDNLPEELSAYVEQVGRVFQDASVMNPCLRVSEKRMQ